MKKKLTKDIGNHILINEGYFPGLKKILDEYEVTDQQAAEIKAGLYKHMLIKILEAKRETIKIQAAVARMEAACRAGAIQNLHTARNAFDGNHSNLIVAFQPFDGWVISLLETHVSLLQTIHNPETGGLRINGLRDSFSKLWNLRAPGYKPYQNFPEVFDLSFFIK